MWACCANRVKYHITISLGVPVGILSVNAGINSYTHHDAKGHCGELVGAVVRATSHRHIWHSGNPAFH
jgi:hypothetical protein